MPTGLHQLSESSPRLAAAQRASLAAGLPTEVELQGGEDLSRRLRISLTDVCNFGCFFCHNEGQLARPQRSASLTVPDYARIVEAAAESGIIHIKLTGGEPLLYRDGRMTILDLVDRIAPLKDRFGLDISMTTNGSRLEKFANGLKSAGLDRVTVSIHAASTASFKAFIARTPGSPAFDGSAALEAASAADLRPLKVNTVLFGDRTCGSVAELDDISRIAAQTRIDEMRLYTIIDAASLSVSPQWVRYWTDGLAEDVGDILFDNTQSKNFAEVASVYASDWSDFLYPRSTLRIRRLPHDIVIEPMKPGRFARIGTTDEGPYALRLASSGRLASMLATRGGSSDCRDNDLHVCLGSASAGSDLVRLFTLHRKILATAPTIIPMPRDPCDSTLLDCGASID